MEEIGMIRELLDREIVKTLEEISEAPPMSEDAKRQLVKLNALHKLRMSEIEAEQKRIQISDGVIRADRENRLREKELEIKNAQTIQDIRLKKQEMEIKKAQLNEGKKDRIVKIVIDGASILVPVGISSYWMAKGLKFEESGTFTSRTMQWVSNHFKLFRK